MLQLYKNTALLCLFIFLMITSNCTAQQSIYIAAEVPVQFEVGYQNQFSKHFSFNVSAGVLTNPNSTIILDVLKAFGTDEEIVLMIDNAFKFGLVGELGARYHFGKNYTGIFFQAIDLQAGDTPTSLVEDYFGTSISNYPTRKGQNASNPVYLTLKSTLLQGGVLYGRVFPLKNRFSLFTEVGISANLYSKSKLSTDSRDLSKLSSAVDSELAAYYKEYAFVPSVSVGLRYNLH